MSKLRPHQPLGPDEPTVDGVMSPDAQFAHHTLDLMEDINLLLMQRAALLESTKKLLGWLEVAQTHVRELGSLPMPDMDEARAVISSVEGKR